MLNNVDSRTHGHTLGIERSMLPDITPVQVAIPRRAGAYIPKKRSRELGILEFKIRLGIIGISRADFRARVRIVAEWLFNLNKNGDAVNLVLSDEPARIYKVWVQGSTPIEQIEDTGEVEINLIAPDPIAQSTALSTSLFDAANAANLIMRNFHDFEQETAGVAFQGQSISIVDTAQKRSGTKSLKILMRETNNNGIYLGTSSTDYHIPVTGGATYVFSYYAFATVPCLTQGHVAFNTADAQKLYSSPQITIPAGVWTRHYFTVTAPADATLALGRVDCDQAWVDLWIDDVQLELATTGQTLPTAYKAPAAVSVKKQMTNNGTYETYPDFRIVPSADLTYIRLSDGKGNYILLTGRTFPAWTNIIIDNKKGEVYFEASGVSLMNWLTIDSRFFKLDPKTTYMLTIEVSAGGALTARVNWQEKFL